MFSHSTCPLLLMAPSYKRKQYYEPSNIWKLDLNHQHHHVDPFSTLNSPSSSYTKIFKSSHTSGLTLLCVLQVANASTHVWCSRLKTVLHCGLMNREENTTVTSFILAPNALAFGAVGIKNIELTGTSKTWNLFTQVVTKSCLSYLALKHLVLTNSTMQFYISFSQFTVVSWGLPETSFMSFTDLISIPSMSWSQVVKLLDRPGTSLQADTGPLVTSCPVYTPHLPFLSTRTSHTRTFLNKIRLYSEILFGNKRVRGKGAGREGGKFDLSSHDESHASVSMKEFAANISGTESYKNWI